MTNHDSCRVLLCDDTPEIRLVLRTLFSVATELDIVAEARDGLEAVHLAEQHRPDVVVLDVSMPVMDGFAAIPEINRVSPESSIVMYSAHASRETQEKALELGAHHFVEKGGQPMEIVETVQDTCAEGA